MLSGVKPTGTLHIGNYFGAMKQFVDLYPQYESTFFIADYHALNSVKDAEEMRKNIIDIAAAYIAIGLDPEKALIFKQSDVPEHTEMTWIFNNLITVSFLMQAHAYKDAVANGKEANVGLFGYPILMASDILLYDTDIVPVGKDQKQHIEYARECASKFNNAYGETFKEPKEYILDDVAVVLGTDGRKMSKGYGNVIPLFATRDEVQKAVMSIVTDSTGERPEHVYAIHRLIKSAQELAPMYEANKGNYKALKEALIEDLDAFIKPLRERRAALNESEVKSILARGAERAREIASNKLADVRKKVGVTL